MSRARIGGPGAGASPGRALFAAAALGLGGYAFAVVVVGLASVALLAAGVPLMERPALLLALSVVMGQGVAFGAFALGYLVYTGRGPRFVGVRLPTLRDVGWSVGGTVALFAGLVALSALFSAFGVRSASNAVEQFGEQDPRIFLLLVPLSFLFIGPGEELLYRGVVQGRLREAFGPWVAITASSFVFAVVHVFSLQGAGKLAYLAVLLVLSPVLGAAYERTGNLVVPSLIHGAFNAVQFYVAYLGATGGLP
ncbi:MULTISPECIES: CPBP family intramembrane glutamic endopeptidase [Halorussus]|uniref:CPBP family intramembrane glutamic endopeptidase n=1 Tax=Halorussus TaxID=1070314 RepID=UPI000E20CD2A|nr:MULTISPECIES: CPBP family intramembrane glutamic endopeptidase [Halorussus]NHN61554.1 CPBP family intramembrane metalloprotease [Halorussus sp. JP-T4]